MLFRPVRFCCIFAMTTVAFAVMSLIALVLFQFEAGSGSAFVPLGLAAAFEGAHFAQDVRQRPNSRAMWRAAFQMAWLAILLSLVLSVVLIVVFPEVLQALAGSPMWEWVGIAVFIAAISLATARIGYWAGIRSAFRQQN